MTSRLLLRTAAPQPTGAVPGTRCCKVPHQEAAFEVLQTEGVTAFFVDLQTPGFDPDDFMERLNESGVRVPTVVFAQHVEERLLELFRDQEGLKVLTRGQYSFQLPGLIADYESSHSARGND